MKCQEIKKVVRNIETHLVVMAIFANRSFVSLDLQDNRVTRLPKHFGLMIHLTELFLDRNELRELPNSMKSMTKLLSLTMDDNEVYSWPWCLEYLTSLTELRFNHNKVVIGKHSCGVLMTISYFFSESVLSFLVILFTY